MRTNRSPTAQADGHTLDMTPLLDVVFILLIFFVVTSSFTREAGLALSRAGAAAPVQPSDAREPVVYIRANGGMELEGVGLEPAALRARLRAVQTPSGPASVQVLVHPLCPLDVLTSVVNSAREAGFTQVRVAPAMP